MLDLGIGGHCDCWTKLFGGHKPCHDSQWPLTGGYFKGWTLCVHRKWISMGNKTTTWKWNFLFGTFSSRFMNQLAQLIASEHKQITWLAHTSSQLFCNWNKSCYLLIQLSLFFYFYAHPSDWLLWKWKQNKWLHWVTLKFHALEKKTFPQRK